MLPQLKEMGLGELYFDIELPLCRVLAEMEVHVSAAQLHILPVLQDIPDDGVIQLLQYLRIGGPSSLRFLAMREAQPLKEDLSQLLS